ncbi:hypothetical protein ACFX2B_023328 [Malus domestica]
MAEQGGEDGELERASEHRCFSHGGHEVELAAAIGGGVDGGGAVAAASGSLETTTGSSRSDLTTSSKETKGASNTYQGWRKGAGGVEFVADHPCWAEGKVLQRRTRTRRKCASKNIKSITPLFGASSIVFCRNRQPRCCLAKTAIFPSKSADNKPKSPPPPFCEFSRLCNDSPPQKGIDFRR